MEVEGGGRGAPLQHCHVKVHAMEIQTVLLMKWPRLIIWGTLHPVNGRCTYYCLYTSFYMNNDPQIPFLDSLYAIKRFPLPYANFHPNFNILCRSGKWQHRTRSFQIFLTENKWKSFAVASKSLRFTTHTFNMEKKKEKTYKSNPSFNITTCSTSSYEKTQPHTPTHAQIKTRKKTICASLKIF